MDWTHHHMTPILITTREAAEMLGVGERTFRALAREHRLRPVALGERTIRWRTDDLRRIVAALAPIADRPEPPQLASGKARARAARLAAEQMGATP